MGKIYSPKKVKKSIPLKVDSYKIFKNHFLFLKITINGLEHISKLEYNILFEKIKKCTWAWFLNTLLIKLFSFISN